MLPPPELEQAWLRQLADEHAQICHERRLDLKPPIIRLSRSTSRWGFWSGAKREICLATALIVQHPWQVVLQIFKHEIAHQVCEELWQQPRAGHGPEFRRACQILGVETPFQRATIDLQQNLLQLFNAQQHKQSPEEQLHQRIRKLLALADSDNEHEAALALARASTLLARHRLDAAELATRSGEAEGNALTQLSINTGQQRLPGYRSAICSLLLAHFAVRVVIASSYNQHHDHRVKTIELLGHRHDVAMAAHCYHFLEERLATLWQKERHRYCCPGSSGGAVRIAKNSYYLGLLAGFNQVLLAEKKSKQIMAKPPPHVKNALMHCETRLDAFVAARFPKLRSTRRRGAKIAGTPYHTALQKGKNLRMSPPLGSAEAPVMALPTTGTTKSTVASTSKA